MAAAAFDVTLVHAMMSADNAYRKAAEAAYTQALSSPELVVQGLLGCLPAGAQPDGARLLAAVLLRQIVDAKRGHWALMSPGGRVATRAALLQFALAEPTPVVANRIGHCVAQAAAAEAWPELLPTVCGGVGGSGASTCLFILEQLPDYAPEMMTGHAMALLPVYTGALGAADLKLRVSGLKATAALLVALPSDKERAPFAPLVQPTLAALAAALGGGHETDAQDVLTALVTVAQNAVDFFRAELAVVVDAMLQVAGAEPLDMATRERALELLVTLCQQSPARVRRCPNVLQIVNACFSFMCNVEDDDDWMTGAYSSENFVDDDEDYVLGDESLEHTVEALGKGVLPAVLGLVPPHASHAEWPKRRAAMSVIAAAAAGSTKALKPHLAEATRALLIGTADPHQRVRFAAITSLASLSELYSGEFQKAAHAAVLPALCAVVGDAANCARVRGHAAACVINFAHPKYCEAEWVGPHVDALLGALCSCFAPGTAPEVMEEALGAVTCVAQVTEADFGRFYPVFMPGIMGILRSATVGQARLRGKALQCVGIIGASVGLETFRPDAVAILQMLMPAMTVAPGAPLPEGYYEYLAPACAQIAKALKEHFVTFLPAVIPPLFATLAVEVECSVTEVQSTEEVSGVTHDEATGMQSTVVEVRGRGQMRITMNTTAVMEKQMAAKTLYEYVESLGRHMADYVEASATHVLPLVVFKYSEDVRNSASFAVGRLFAAAVDAARSGLKPPAFATQLLWPSVDTLVQGLKGEVHADPRCCMSEALRDVLQACFESGGKDPRSGAQLPPNVALAGAQATAVVAAVLEVATASLTRRRAKMTAFSASDELEEEDAERLEEELEEEDELMTNLVDCVGYVLKALRDHAVPLFDTQVAPLFGQFLAPGNPASLKHNAVCLFDDMVEFGGPASAKYLPAFLPVLVASLDAADEPFIVQAAVYGLMQVAKKFPDAYRSCHATVTPKLAALAAAPVAEGNELVVENCVAALGAVATATLAAGPEQQQLLRLWLSKLPLREDEVEAKVVHAMLVDLIETGNPAIVGENFAMLPQVLGVFGALLDSVEALKAGEPESLVDGSTRDRMVAIAKQVTAQVPAPQVAAAFGALEPSHQAALQKALTA